MSEEIEVGGTKTMPPGKYVYNRVGHYRVEIELQEGGNISPTLGFEHGWRMDDDSIVLSGSGLDAVMFEWSEADGLWTGQFKWQDAGKCYLKAL